MITFLSSIIILMASFGWVGCKRPSWLRFIGQQLVRIADAMEAAGQSYSAPRPKPKPALTPEVIADPLKQDLVSALVNLGTPKRAAETAATSAIGKASGKDFDSVFLVALQIARSAA
jgi:hypothetical protein